MRKIILGEDIALRALRVSDASSIFRIFDSEREFMGRWLPFVAVTTKPEHTEAAVKILSSDVKNPTFVILYRGKLVGMVGFKSTSAVNCRTEIGYWLSEEFNGRGIVTQAVNRLCHFAFDEMKMNRVEIKCAVENTRSSNIPKRLNFIFEGVERCGERMADGGYADIEVYSKLRSEHIAEMSK